MVPQRNKQWKAGKGLTSTKGLTGADRLSISKTYYNAVATCSLAVKRHGDGQHRHQQRQCVAERNLSLIASSETNVPISLYIKREDIMIDLLLSTSSALIVGVNTYTFWIWPFIFVYSMLRCIRLLHREMRGRIFWFFLIIAGLSLLMIASTPLSMKYLLDIF